MWIKNIYINFYGEYVILFYVIFTNFIIFTIYIMLLKFFLQVCFMIFTLILGVPFVLIPLLCAQSLFSTFLSPLLHLWYCFWFVCFK
jgi:hypothetical protein